MGNKPGRPCWSISFTGDGKSIGKYTNINDLNLNKERVKKSSTANRFLTETEENVEESSQVDEEELNQNEEDLEELDEEEDQFEKEDDEEAESNNDNADLNKENNLNEIKLSVSTSLGGRLITSASALS